MTDSKENDSPVQEKNSVQKSDPKQKQSKIFHYLIRDSLQIIFFASPMLIYHAIRLITNQKHHGGFFCDDNSIKYPYKESRISETAVVIQTITIPIIIIMVLETYIHKKSNENTTKSTSSLIERIYKYVINYLSAYIVCCSFMWLPKYFNGNLRPHFFDVCQPVLNIDKNNPCDDPKNFGKFITDYYCSKTYMPSIYRTFPSGHASQSCFAVCYLIMFIQRKISAIRLRICLQFVLVCYAIFVSLSRIYDYHHHPSDVFFGALLGLLCWLVVVKVVENDFIVKKKCNHQEKEQEK